MSPLSILPGRIRFEKESLIGDVHGCRMIEAALAGVDGVASASANYRTGRITVRFDESRINKDSLAASVENAASVNNPHLSARSVVFSETKSRKAHQSDMAGHAVVGLLARAFLPKPFNVLLPIALQTIRR